MGQSLMKVVIGPYDDEESLQPPATWVYDPVADQLGCCDSSTSPNGGGSGKDQEKTKNRTFCAKCDEQIKSFQMVLATSYPEFQSSVIELNEMASHFLDPDGKQLIFAVKKGSDQSFFWKHTVKIACVKVDSRTKKIHSCQCLSFKQYLRLYNGLKSQLQVLRDLSEVAEKQHQMASSSSGEKAAAVTSSKISSQDPTTVRIGSEEKPPFWSSKYCHSQGFHQSKSSFLLDDKSNPFLLSDQLDDDDRPGIDPSSLDECCICLERKPDIILPCTHSYCLPCIEQWNVNHKTCPVCRETLSSTSEGWVISEGPDIIDIAQDIQNNLMKLTN